MLTTIKVYACSAVKKYQMKGGGVRPMRLSWIRPWYIQGHSVLNPTNCNDGAMQNDISNLFIAYMYLSIRPTPFLSNLQSYF